MLTVFLFLAVPPVHGSSEKDVVEHMGTIHVKTHCAREIMTARDIVQVSVGSDEIADIVLPPTRSPRLIRILGKNPGRTNLIIWYDNPTAGKKVMAREYEIVVGREYVVEVITGTATDETGSLKGW